MIQAILFDLDGTLLDTNEVVIQCLQDIAVTHRGTPFTQAELGPMMGMPLPDQMGRLARTPEEIPALVQAYRDLYAGRSTAMTKIFPGIAPLLQALKSKGYPLGVVTNKGKVGLTHGLQQFQLESYFDVLVAMEDVTQNKPHPEGLHKGMQALNVAPEQTVFVGDSKHDLEAGLHAGCKTALVGWSILDFRVLMACDPTVVIQRPAGLLSWLGHPDESDRLGDSSLRI